MQSELRGVRIFTSQAWQMNSLAIPIGKGLAVVDPGFFPDELDRIAEFTWKTGGASLILYTHGDFDHIVGDSRFPGVPSVAQASFIKRDRARVIKQLVSFDAQLYVRRQPAASFPEPMIIFDGSHHLETDDEVIELYHSPGHTEDSLVAVLQSRKLLVAGDMLSDLEFPFVEFSSEAYLASLRLVEGLVSQGSVTAAIPGHGSPAFTPEELLDRVRRDTAYVQEMRAVASRTLADGRPRKEAERLLCQVQYRGKSVETHLRGNHRKNARHIVGEVFDADH